MQMIKDEMETYEEALAQNTLKALQTMNQRMQNEITNFLNLKIRVAFLKSGIQKQVEKNTGENLFPSSDEFFSQIENKIILKIDQGEFKH